LVRTNLLKAWDNAFVVGSIQEISFHKVINSSSCIGRE
jgi:hypothetical protein